MAEKKRILIFTADAGFGHRSAANAVLAALEDRYASRCEAVIVNPMDDRSVPSLLRRQQSDYDRIIQEVPDLYQFGYKTSDASVPTAIFESVLTVMLYEAVHAAVKQFRPHAIVSTYPLYQAPLAALYTVKRRYTPTLTIVTDLVSVHRLWFNDVVDLCLVPTPQVRSLALKAGLPVESVQITGIPVNPRLADRQTSKLDLRRALGWDEQRTTVLVTGSQRVRNLPEILRAFNHAFLPVQLALVAGGSQTLLDFYQENEWHIPVYTYGFVKNMPDMMRAADCIVCKAGGLIVTESLAAGLPMLLVDVLPGQETGNAQLVVEDGAGELGTEPLDALEILSHWLMDDGRLLRERAEQARRLGRPQAAFEVAELALKAAERGPQIRPGPLAQSRAGLIEMLHRFGVRPEEQPGAGS